MVERINCIEGISCLKPEGAFYVMMNIRNLMGRKFNGRKLEDSMDFAELLLAEKHVAVVPGIAFEAEGFCRLSYATSEDRIIEGLNRIEAFIKELE
jgi:aspartate aminotransferase